METEEKREVKKETSSFSAGTGMFSPARWPTRPGCVRSRTVNRPPGTGVQSRAVLYDSIQHASLSCRQGDRQTRFATGPSAGQAGKVKLISACRGFSASTPSYRNVRLQLW